MKDSRLKIQYICARCMHELRTVFVRYRYNTEDVGYWAENIVQWEIELDHDRNSPYCLVHHFNHVRVPTPENSPGIGIRPILHS